jgi:hypothetical protein
VESGLFCERPFAETSESSLAVNWIANPALGTQDEQGVPFPNPYYYLPAGDTKIESSLLCLNYSSANTQSYRRLMLISGKNRDLYGGPSCAYYRKGYNPNSVLDNYPWEGISYGLTHIGYEQSSIGRGLGAGQSIFGGTFPMEDAVLQLPLFGAEERGIYDNPECPDSPCCEGNLPPDENCLICGEVYNPTKGEPSDGYGHYLPKDQGSTAGYFSFACFNPQSYLYNPRVMSDQARNRIEFPTCSLWAYIKGIRNYIYNVERQYESTSNQNCADLGPEFCACGETAADINWANGTNDGESWWKNIDPGGTNAAGTSNVRLVLDQLENRVEKIRVYNESSGSSCDTPGGYHLVTPKVFLWDADAFINASIQDRWKHIYTIGYSNILWDSGCTNTQDTVFDPESGTTGFVPGVRNEMLYIDNVCHEVGVGSTGAARLISWMGCGGDPTPGVYADYLRGLRCDGRNYGSPIPTQQPSEFDCTDCLLDRDGIKDCEFPFWTGYYDRSVTACENYSIGVCPSSVVSVCNSGGYWTGMFYSANNSVFPIGDEAEDLYPGKWQVAFGANNGNCPSNSTVSKLATRVSHGSGNNWTGSHDVYQWSVAIKTNNKMQQWGGGGYDDPNDGGIKGTQVYGDGFNYAYVKFPSTITDVSKVTISGIHGLALKSDGGLTAWGLSGSFGVGQKSVQNTPSTGTFIDVAAGGFVKYCAGPPQQFYLTSVSGAVKNTGELVLWGDNNWGQIGPDTLENPYQRTFCVDTFQGGAFPPPAIVPAPSNAELSAEGGCTAVCFGGRATGVITNSPVDGVPQYKVKVWGWKGWTANPLVYVNYLDVPSKGVKNIKQLVILDPFCCVALKHDGTIIGWGTLNIAETYGGISVNGWGWDKLVERGITNETNVVEITGIANESVVVRRADGSIGIYSAISIPRFNVPYCP